MKFMAVAFLNSFLSYLLVFVIFVAVIAIGVTLGIKLRRKKDAKEALLQSSADNADTDAKKE